MKTYIGTLSFFALLITNAYASGTQTTYFSCKIKEPTDNGKNITVTVKFAVENLNIYEEEGTLVQYPGSTEEDEKNGTILVIPRTYGKEEKYTRMSNLNGQGGDLRIEGRNLRLFGDGDGYQFTDLVVWNVDEDEEVDILEGYVRDYGPAYGDSGEESFKQFIKCRRSSRVL